MTRSPPQARTLVQEASLREPLQVFSRYCCFSAGEDMTVCWVMESPVPTYDRVVQAVSPQPLQSGHQGRQLPPSFPPSFTPSFPPCHTRMFLSFHPLSSQLYESQLSSLGTGNESGKQ